MCQEGTIDRIGFLTNRTFIQLFTALLLVGLLPFSIAPNQANAAEVSTTTSGYKFAVALPPGNGGEVWTLYVSSGETGTFSVDFPTGTDSPTAQVAPGRVTSLEVPIGAQMTGAQTGKLVSKVTRLTSTVPITVYGCSKQYATSDCTNFIPISSWGTSYRTLSANSYFTGNGDRITIFTADDTSTITLRFKTAVSTGSGSFSAGAETTTTILPNEVWTLEATTIGQGFSGTLISSSANIGVIAGADCMNLTTEFNAGGACDTNVEMVPPISAWGTNFYVNNFQNNSNPGGSGLKILASEDTTTVTISGDTSTTFSLAAGETFKSKVFETSSAMKNLSVKISSSKPILVAHFMFNGSYTSLGGTDNGDPALTYIVPYEQYLNEYTFVSAPSFKAQFVNVIATETAVSSLKLDGVLVSSSEFRDIGAGTGWRSAQLRVGTGTHTMSSNLPFGIEIYGVDYFDSYAYVGGANYSALSSVAALQLSASSTTGTVGQEKCVPVTVLDASDAPVLGVRVDGSVSGANGPSYPSGFTNSSGVAQVCYTGNSSGTDTVTFTANGFTTTATIVWSLDAPSISYSPSYLSLATNVSMPTLTPTNTGGAISSYSVSGTLPTGVSLDTSTGVVSGTPSANSARETFTVTATNATGSSSATLSLEVIPAVQPTISYPQSTYSFTLDSTISTLIPVTEGTFPTWSVSPSLPRGLSIDSQSGRITGTPTRVTATASYTVTATNSAGSSTTTLQLTVAETAPDVSFNVTIYSFVVNSAISVITPVNSGSPATSWSISPALPSGLAFSTLNGQISGTPTGTSAATSYTVTGSNSAGSDTATVSIAVSATLAAPNISYSPDSIVGTVNSAITSLSPTNSGGAVSSWSVSPDVPAGLSFSTSTGIFSGTPTATSASATYAVTATNATGSATFNVTISVSGTALTAPVISYSPATVSGTVNSAISTLTPSNSGGAATSWSISPSVPTGLTFSTSTGAISGTPTATSASSTYTVTATNSAGSGTATLTISVASSGSSSGSSTDATQTITFESIIDEASPGTNTKVFATASSGALVNISTQVSDVCEMRNGWVHFLIRGTCTVVASAGRTTVNGVTYAATQATMTISVRTIPYLIPMSLDPVDAPRIVIQGDQILITTGKYRMTDNSTFTLSFVHETIIYDGKPVVTLVFNPGGLMVPSYMTPWHASEVRIVSALSELTVPVRTGWDSSKLAVMEFVVAKSSSVGRGG